MFAGTQRPVRESKPRPEGETNLTKKHSKSGRMKHDFSSKVGEKGKGGSSRRGSDISGKKAGPCPKPTKENFCSRPVIRCSKKKKSGQRGVQLFKKAHLKGMGFKKRLKSTLMD